MNRRIKAALLIGGLAVAAAVGTTIALTEALARTFDRGNNCETGYSRLVTCRLHWSSHTIRQGKPAFESNLPPRFQPTYTETTVWAVAECPENSIATRLLCPVPSSRTQAEAMSDSSTGLPLPKPWLVKTAKNSRFIESLPVETPLDLAATLRFYRTEMTRRGWTETDGADIGPDHAATRFTTSDGSVHLRMTRQDGRTIAYLSRLKPGIANSEIEPKPGLARLRLGNTTEEEAVITINGQTIELASRAGEKLTDSPETGHKSPGSQEIDLLPGKYKVALRIAGGATQNREFELAAGETWGLLAGPDGIPLPLHLF
jgi:hypothetical protein